MQRSSEEPIFMMPISDWEFLHDKIFSHEDGLHDSKTTEKDWIDRWINETGLDFSMIMIKKQELVGFKILNMKKLTISRIKYGF